MSRWQSRVTIVACAVLVAACERGEHADEAEIVTAEPATEAAIIEELPPAPAVPATPEDWVLVRQQMQLYTDSADRVLRRVPNLTRAERTLLRRDVNEVQITRARMMGFRISSSADAHVRSGRLTKLAPTTKYWIVRELDYSLPYVTPDAEAMLKEIGRRFHARLDSLGVPRFRLDITSVLRTPETQAALRKRNSNASRVESSHEFGTTVDIAYRRFAPPADHPLADAEPHIRAAADSTLLETGRLRGAELQAVLGRVMLDLQREGKLLVMMERRQTVYHITVAQRMPRQRVSAP